MPEQRIDPVLVDKAIRAWFNCGREREKAQGLDAGLTWEEFVANENGEQEEFGWTLDELREQVEAASRVVFNELRLKEEGVPLEVQRAYLTNPEFHAQVEQARRETGREAGHPVSTEQVLLGWFGRPVEQGDTK